MHHGDLRPVGAGRRRDLQPDPARARDHQMAVLPAQARQDLAQPVAVRDAAQMVDPGELGAGDVEAARFRAGRQQQLVVRDGRAVAEPHGPRGAVDQVDGLAEVQFDVVLRVPGRFMDAEAVAFGLAQQIALGQGRALVGVIAFVPDEDHPPGEPLRAQGLGRLGAREPSTDDDERLIRVDHLMPPRKHSARSERPAHRVMREEGVTRSGHRPSHPVAVRGIPFLFRAPGRVPRAGPVQSCHRPVGAAPGRSVSRACRAPADTSVRDAI